VNAKEDFARKQQTQQREVGAAKGPTPSPRTKANAADNMPAAHIPWTKQIRIGTNNSAAMNLFHQPRWSILVALFRHILVMPLLVVAQLELRAVPELNQPARQYLGMLENFAGFAEQHWNEKEQSYDAKGSGVTWARGNGGICLVNAVLLTEFPERATFSPAKIPREVLVDHVRLTLRSLCLQNKACTDVRAVKPGTWGGADGSSGGHWQAGLETEHWVLAAHLLAPQLDADTKALVRQVASAEADLAIKTIPSAKRGNTAADDCVWNAGVLGVCAAIYADDPRAANWDEWAKRWALNTESREADRASRRMIDGKPLGEWLVSTNVFADLTMENHGFWDLPYQVSFAALAEPIIAYQLSNRKIPEAFHAHALEEGNEILKWLVMPDGDLLCPQGIDWAERDVQHSWAFTELGTFLDQPWARAAEARCLQLLTKRQAVFGDGSIHALDFGYETDLAVMWAFSALLHKHFGKAASGVAFDEPRGPKLFPHVATAVYRAPDLVSSVTWFRSRQAVMVSPNNLRALAERPAFTRYDHESGTGWILFKGDRKHRAFRVKGEPRIAQESGALTVNFTREVPGLARQDIGYCALPGGKVALFSRWQALKDIDVVELVDHPFRWVEIDKFISKPSAAETAPAVWNIDGKLQMQILNGADGELARDGLNGSVRRSFTAKANEVLQDNICIYQPLAVGAPTNGAKLEANTLRIGDWRISRAGNGDLSAELTKTP